PWRRARSSDPEPFQISEPLMPASGRCLGNHLTAIVVAAGGAKVMRQLQLAAVRAFLMPDRLQRMMAATHVATRRRSFSLGYCHGTPKKYLMQPGNPGHSHERATILIQPPDSTLLIGIVAFLCQRRKRGACHAVFFLRQQEAPHL